MSRCLILALATLLLAPPNLSAQMLDVRLGGGAARPVAGSDDLFASGPAAQLSLGAQLSRVFGLRLDAEWGRLAGGHVASEPDDVHVYGASLNVVLRVPDLVVTPYALVGIGAFRIHPGGDEPYYGTTGAVQAGLGVELHVWDRVRPFAEIRQTLHLTDVAAPEFRATVVRPAVVGVSVPLGRSP